MTQTHPLSSTIIQSDSLTGSKPTSHVMFGGGVPSAWQSMAISDPISTHTGEGKMVKKGRAGGVCVCRVRGCKCGGMRECRGMRICRSVRVHGWRYV